MTQAIATQFTTEKVEKVVSAILAVLGEPTSNEQRQAWAAFQVDDHHTVKLLAAFNLNDNYIKSLGYLGGALKLTPNTATILAEAARAAAEHHKERTLSHLSDKMKSALI